MAGIAWGDAAGAMVDERRKQRTEATDLQQQLADIAYRQALVRQAEQQDQRLRQQMEFEREKFAFDKEQLGQKASDERNQRGLINMAGDIADQYPGEPQKMVGTLIRAGVNVPAGMLVPNSADPYTLGPNQTRFNAQNEQVAQGPTAATGGATLGSFEDYVGRKFGQGATPAQIQQARKEYMQADDRPLQSQQPRRVTSGDANRIAELDTSINDLNVLEKELGTTGAASKVGAMLPNVVTEFTGLGADAKARQGVIDRVKQVIGKALEGGVLRREDEYKYVKILPTIGDPPSVAKAKLNGLRAAIEQRRGTTIDALEDAEYNVDKFRTRTPPPAGPTASGGGAGRVYYDSNGNPVKR